MPFTFPAPIILLNLLIVNIICGNIYLQRHKSLIAKSYRISKISPEKDSAGIVIITLLVNGLSFAFVGYLIRNHSGKKNKKKKKIHIQELHRIHER